MKILITGATGYLGPDLIQRLRAHAFKIHCLIRDEKKLQNINNLYELSYTIGDLTNPETIINLTKDIDYVVHLAVLAPDQKHTYSIEEYRQVNVQGTENLLKECLRNPVKKIICFSSSAAVGLVNSKIIDESTTCNPKTEYGISKYESDILVKRYSEEHNLPIITLRFTHIYGPGEKRDFLRIVRLINKGILPIIGFGENLYPAVYKDDAISSILLALQKGKIGHLYNISGKNSYDLRLIIKYVKSELGIVRLPLWIPKYPALFFLKCLELLGIPFPIASKNIKFVTAARRFSIEKAKKELGYSPKIDILEGIKKTIEYYKREKLI